MKRKRFREIVENITVAVHHHFSVFLQIDILPFQTSRGVIFLRALAIIITISRLFHNLKTVPICYPTNGYKRESSLGMV